jgi:hypothetical protein
MSFLKKLFRIGTPSQHPFRVGEHVISILENERRTGEITRILGRDQVEVDWYSGDAKGRHPVSVQGLRLDPGSSSNRNPFRIGDKVVNDLGETYRVTGIWGQEHVRAEKLSEKGVTYEIHVIHLKKR